MNEELGIIFADGSCCDIIEDGRGILESEFRAKVLSGIFPRNFSRRGLNMKADSVVLLTVLLNHVPLWLSEARRLL